MDDSLLQSERVRIVHSIFQIVAATTSNQMFAANIQIITAIYDII